MKRTRYAEALFVAIMAVTALSVLPVIAAGTMDTTTQPAQPGAGPDAMAMDQPRGTISLSITDSGIIVPSGQMHYGQYNVSITNNSSQPRGLVMMGTDLGGTPYRRFISVLRPGTSTNFDFFFAPGDVTFRDFMSASRTQTAYTNVRYGTFSSSLNFFAPPGSPAAPAGPGAGPGTVIEARGEVGTVGVVHGTIPIRITNNAIVKDVGEAPFGTYVVRLTNDSSRSRGLLFTGIDLCCTRYWRYSSILRPGQTSEFRFFFAPGKVEIYDFLSATKKATAVTNVERGPLSSSIIFQ